MFKLLLNLFALFTTVVAFASPQPLDREQFLKSMNTSISTFDRKISELELQTTKQSDRIQSDLPDRIAKIKRFRFQLAKKGKRAEAAPADKFSTLSHDIQSNYDELNSELSRATH